VRQKVNNSNLQSQDCVDGLIVFSSLISSFLEQFV
jgi:hypothetical protein